MKEKHAKFQNRPTVRTFDVDMVVVITFEKNGFAGAVVCDDDGLPPFSQGVVTFKF